MLPELRKTPYQVVFEYKTEANTSTTSYTGK
jgi:hypothetical protein